MPFTSSAADDNSVQLVRAFMDIQQVRVEDVLLLDAIDALISRRLLPDDLVHLSRSQLFVTVARALRDQTGHEHAIDPGIGLDQLRDQLAQLVLHTLQIPQP